MDRDSKGRFIKGNHYSIKTEFKKGSKLSKKIKDKISKKLKGRKATKEALANMKKVQNNRSKKWCDNISKAKKGKHRSYESRVKISLGNSKEKIFTGFKKNLNKRIRELITYKEWRLKVFSRDNFTCQNSNCPYCYNVKWIKLEAHHKISIYKILKKNKIKKLNDAMNCKELWDTNNGKTFCLDSHIKEDNYRGRGDKDFRI